MAKNLPVKKEVWVQSLGKEDPLEKEMTTHWSILPWKIPWTEEPGWGSQRLGHNLVTEQQRVPHSTYIPCLYPFIYHMINI